MIEEMLIFTAIACVGVIVVSFAGFGFALTMVPLLSLFYSPKQFLPAYHMFAPVCMLALALESRRHIHWRFLARILVVAVIGAPLGAIALKHLPAEVVSLAIAVLTLTFAGYLLLNKEVRMGRNTIVEVLVGFCSGFLNGCTAMSGPPVVMYGLARQWDRDVFRSTLLVYFSFLSVITLGSYFIIDMMTVESEDMITFESGATAGAAILPALAVGHFGIRLKNKVNEALFRRVVLVAILCLGIIGVVSYFIRQ
jgi:hypothetical protein